MRGGGVSLVRAYYQHVRLTPTTPTGFFVNEHRPPRSEFLPKPRRERSQEFRLERHFPEHGDCLELEDFSWR